METVNVLHVVETMEIGGAERVVAEFVNGFPSRFRSTVCCLKRSGPMADRIRRPGVEVVELRKPEGDDLRTPLRLARLLKQKDIHVLQSHNWATFLECALAGLLAGTPVRVHLQHGETAPGRRGLLAAAKRRLRFRLEALLSASYDSIVAVSEQALGSLLLERPISRERLRVIRNGVDLPPAAARSEEARRRLGLAPEAFAIISTGRLAEVKNYSLLLRAFEAVRAASVRPVRLLLAGDGPERGALERQAREAGLAADVSFLGARSDVAELLSAADLYVVSSRSEGISLALLEAMARGLPAVATRVGGNAEVVEDGRNGLLVESGDAAGMARAILSLAADEGRRRSLGEAARRGVEQRFDLAHTIRAFEELYLGFLGKRRAA